MIIIFDLDYTLLDTRQLSKKIAKILGLNFSEFKKNVQQNFKNRPIHYNAYKHINILIKKGIIKKQKVKTVRKGLVDLFRDMDDFLYPDAEAVLFSLKNKKNKLILLTFGDLLWQKLKIRNLSVKKYFSRIIITDKAKSGALDFLKSKKEKVVFINDNARECRQIKALIPRIKIILVAGPFSDNVKHNFKKFQLKECLAVV